MLRLVCRGAEPLVRQRGPFAEVRHNKANATTRPTPQQGQRHNKAKAKAHGEPASREDGWQRGRQPEAEEHVDPTGPGSRRPRLAKVLETFEVDTAPLPGRA